MAKKRDERKAQREQKRNDKATQKVVKAQELEQKRNDKAAQKVVKAQDLEKIKVADESAKASIKAKKQSDKAEKKRKRKGLPPSDVGPAKFNTEPRRVANITSDPDTGSQVTTEYKSLADYAKANPSESATPTISGKDPKTETKSNIIDKSTSFNEMKSGETLGNEVKNSVDNVVDEAEKSEFAIDASRVKKAEDELNNPEEPETKTTRGGYEPYPGDGGTLGDIARQGEGKYELTDEQYAQLAQEHRMKNATAKASAPAAAIEALGIEHYYPPQKDFITSNFTGRYIGSRELVAATGALLPEGLTDARNRAKQAKAKAKAELESKFWELGSTTPQYDERYKDIGMDMLNKYYDLSGGDIAGLLSGKSELSQQFMRDMYDYQARGKNLESINTSINDLITKMNEGEEYIPPEIIKNMYDFRAGTADLDEYMQGKGIGDEKVRRMVNTLRSYQNFTPLANKQIALLNSAGGNKLPLNKDADWSDPTFATRMSEAISKVKNKGVGYDEYVKVMGEFYDVKEVETIVRNLYETNNLYEGTTKEEYEKQIQNGVKYFMAMLPDKIDIDQKLQANQSLGWANLNQRKREFNFDKQKYEDQKISMWDGVNIDLNEANMRAEAIDAYNKAKDPKSKAEAWKRVLASQNKTAVDLGGITVAAVPTQGTTLASAQSDRLSVIGADGKMYSLDKMISMYWERTQKYPNNKEYQNALQELEYVKNYNGDIQHQVSGRYAGYSVYDTEKNGYVPVEYATGSVSADDLVNTAYLSGKVGIVDYVDGKPVTQDGEIVPRPSSFTYINKYNIEGEEVRRALTREEGTEEKTSRYTTRGGKELVETSSGSSSSN